MYTSNDFRLYHHGILGQKWGARHGPPYPLGGGDYSVTEKKKIYRARKNPNSIYNKKHFDTVLKKDKTTLSTLSYDPNRTKDTDMFYATYKRLDKAQYGALFNKKVPQTVYDKNGKTIGTGSYFKYKIDNKVSQNVKVASEDSAAKAFMKLYRENRDFYNYVTDKSRMSEQFVDSKYRFKGYRDSRKVINKLQNPDYKPTDKDVKTLYRMFNYTIPSDGAGNARAAKDVATQRARFFNELKKMGYGACLDTNDAIYGGFKATAPVIVFDMDSVVPDSVRRTTMSDKAVSSALLFMRKTVGV